MIPSSCAVVLGGNCEVNKQRLFLLMGIRYPSGSGYFAIGIRAWLFNRKKVPKKIFDLFAIDEVY